jgi:hypothetical protein
VLLAAAIALAVVLRIALHRGFRPAVALARIWERVRPGLFAYVRAAPGTFVCLSIVTVTTWVLVGVTPDVAASILHQHSSNLYELARNPVKALVRSAFWLDEYVLLAWTATLAIVLAPVERWLGTLRWVVVFATGHVGATIATAAAIWLAIRSGHAPRSLETTVDVGVSYGFAAVAGILTWGLDRRQAIAWAASIASLLLVALAISRTYTDFGHIIAFTIGLALRPLTPIGDDTPQQSRPDPIGTTIRLLTRLGKHGD